MLMKQTERRALWRGKGGARGETGRGREMREGGGPTEEAEEEEEKKVKGKREGGGRQTGAWKTKVDCHVPLHHIDAEEQRRRKRRMAASEKDGELLVRVGAEGEEEEMDGGRRWGEKNKTTCRISRIKEHFFFLF